MRSATIEVWRALLDFLYPPVCLVCDEMIEKGSGLVCDGCWASLEPGLNIKSLIFNVISMAPFDYSSDLKSIVHQFKYKAKKSLSEPLGSAMARPTVKENEYSSADILMPVPLHRIRRRMRGFNQSRLLAETVSRHTGIPCISDVLVRLRHTEVQALLSPTQRAVNVRGAFSVTNPEVLTGKNIILVDDVITTGSTINECASVLRESGANDVFALAAAIAVPE